MSLPAGPGLKQTCRTQNQTIHPNIQARQEEVGRSSTPGARLPISIPKHHGQLSWTTQRKRNRTKGHDGRLASGLSAGATAALPSWLLTRGRPYCICIFFLCTAYTETYSYQTAYHVPRFGSNGTSFVRASREKSWTAVFMPWGSKTRGPVLSAPLPATTPPRPVPPRRAAPHHAAPAPPRPARGVSGFRVRTKIKGHT